MYGAGAWQKLKQMSAARVDQATDNEAQTSAAYEQHQGVAVADARSDRDLVGFLNVVTDGGVHAWLQDVVVDPKQQRRGIGKAMVELAVQKSSEAGCEWLHAEFDDDVAPFYLDRCDFRATAAGLRYLQ